MNIVGRKVRVLIFRSHGKYETGTITRVSSDPTKRMPISVRQGRLEFVYAANELQYMNGKPVKL